ncbi:MAG: hypothetical protein IJ104_04105 [Methanobrevibacter sp.]|nr:hypothetical protein [Methanobrevibacter sp.]
MIINYLKEFLSDKIGSARLSKSFIDLLKYYNLTYEDGLEIQKEAFEVLNGVSEGDDCLMWKFRIVKNIKLNFSLIYDDKSYYKFDDKKFSQYFCRTPFPTFIKMKSYLIQYFEGDDDVRQCIEKFNERGLAQYFDTFRFYLQHSKISKITNINEVLGDFEKSLDLSLSYSVDDAVEFLIENTSKEYIEYIRNFKDMDDYAMKMHMTKSVRNIKEVFFIHDIYNPNQLYFDCYKSELYNVPKFDDNWIVLTIFKALYLKVTSDYDNIIANTDFKNRNYFEDLKNFRHLTIPKTIDESVTRLVEMSSKEHIDFVRASDKDDYRARTHLNLGMYIRNNFLVQGMNHDLFVECLRKKDLKYDYWHMSEASGVLIGEFWEYVQKNYDEIMENTNFENRINMTSDPYVI